MDYLDKFKACLLGGAIGDALGYSVEFLKREEIINKYSKKGITDLLVDKVSNKALVSDDTQMTLFTADGLIGAHIRCSERGIGSYEGSGTYQSYLRWCYTQTGVIKDKDWLEKQSYEHSKYLPKHNKSIMEYKELFNRRAPGKTCIDSLLSGQMGTIERSINNSKGCGGVMRVAPVGLLLNQYPRDAFYTGMRIAAITHGHPTGYIAAGAFAFIIAELVNGKSLEESLKETIILLKENDNNKETINALNEVLRLSKQNIKPTEAIKLLGEGWVAEEALAIAVYCALKEKDFKKALIMAVNHDGDSDSTGSICGNIIGARDGMKVIPKEWLEKIELRELIEDLAENLFQLAGPETKIESEACFGVLSNSKLDCADCEYVSDNDIVTYSCEVYDVKPSIVLKGGKCDEKCLKK